MSDFISFNGSLIQKDKFNPDFFNRSFSYGDGLFETVKMINSKILFWPDHFERLLVGLHTLKMTLPASFHMENLRSEMLGLALKNKSENCVRIKINLFRDSTGWYQPTDNSFSYVIQTFENNQPDYEFPSKGLKIKAYKEILKPINLLSGFKNCNSLVYVMAGIFASETRSDDAILLNEKQNVCEFISSNIFISKNNKWITPPLNEGCIDGVMRKQLLRIIKANFIDFEEAIITEKDLQQADEIILTNVSQGIRWVDRFNNKQYYNKRADTLYQLLSKSINDKKVTYDL